MNDTAEFWGIQPGYHDVFGRWHDANPETVSRLVEALSRNRASPPDLPELQGERAFQGNGVRRWGVAVQLYAVRSARNWGIGDFGDLERIITVAAAKGASAVGLNPLHALFLDQPEMASPYAPNSRLFLNPLFIDVDSIPEFADGNAFGQDIGECRTGDLVDYAAVARLKLRALRSTYDRFAKNAASARKDAFEAFRSSCGESLTRFSCFETLRQRYAPAPWREWPAPWSHPPTALLHEFHRSEVHECGFHEFMQWIADEQLAQCKMTARRCGLSTGLYLDLAVGVHPDGADAWSNQDAVLADFSIGAPPDEFNRAGQDWGLAPFNPHALPDNDFAVMRNLLGAVMRHAGAVRLDHVLSLMRLFLVPRGKSPADGAYVKFPFEPLLRVIAEESHKYRCVFIGEDLGTVPEGFRETAAHWGIWSYRVMIFERGGQGEFKRASDYPADALATFGTHDLPTFRGWMSGHDLSVKREIGVDPGETEDDRERSRAALRHALAPGSPNHAPESFAAVAAYLAQVPSRLTVVAVEDLLDVKDQINIPATVDQHPNWRGKLPVPIEDRADHPIWNEVAAVFRDAGRADGD